MLSVYADAALIEAEGEVGYETDGFTRQMFREALTYMSGDFTLRLQSEGGDVFTGQSIYNMLQRHDGKVRIELDSLCASIATIIMCGGDWLVARKNTTVMVHNPYTIAIGDADEFRHTADVLDKLTDDSAEIYAERTGKKPAYWRDVMSRETWYSAEQALEVGLIDEIEGSGAAAPKRQRAPSVAVQSVTAKRSPAVVRAEFRRKLVDTLTGKE